MSEPIIVELNEETINNVENYRQANIISTYSVDFDDFPSEISTFTNIEGINIDNNDQLTRIPPTILKMPHLKLLAISSSMLENIDGIEQLGELEELNIAKTCVEHIPESIGKLQKLQTLRIRLNGIEELPTSLGDLVNLKNLEMDNLRHLRIFPDCSRLHLDKIEIGESIWHLTPESKQNLKNLVKNMINAGRGIYFRTEQLKQEYFDQFKDFKM